MDGATAPAPGSRARLHFHVSLALVLFPLFTLPVVFLFVLINLLNPQPTDEHRRWTRNLILLFALDVLLAPVVVVLMLRQETEGRGLSGPVAIVRPSARIGIEFGKDGPEGAPRIVRVVPGWPAERAGFRPGDLIVYIDGRPVHSVRDAQRIVGESVAGASRRILVVREGETLEIPVVPWTPAAEGEESLFHPVPGPFDLKPLFRSAGWWIGTAVLVLAAWGWSRRRPGPRVKVWRGLLAALSLTVAGTIGAAWLVHRIQGGWSTGGTSLLMLAQMLFMLAGAWAGARLCGPAEPLPPAGTPLLSLGKTLSLGLLYHVTGLVRVGLAVLAVDRFILGGAGAPPSSSLEQVLEGSRSPLGMLLFALPVVLVGPLAEEALFRGFLLPRLARAVGVPLALGVSSLLFGLFHPHLRMYLILVAFAGAVFGWARLRSGGLRAPVLLHVLHNGVVTVLAFLR